MGCTRLNPIRHVPAVRDQALTVTYLFDVPVFTGLDEEGLSEVINLLRIHADREQLLRLRAEIDAILEDEAAFEHVLRAQTRIEALERALSGQRLCGWGRLFGLAGWFRRLAGRVRAPRQLRVVPSAGGR